MKKHLLQSVAEGIEAITQLRAPKALHFLDSVSRLLADTFRSGNKLLIAGNGGSLCDATHFAEELSGYFRRPRAALPAMAISDPGHLTCVANDVGFDEIFARGVEAFGQSSDCFVGLSTSGNSPNIVRAFEVAQQRGLATVAFLGKGGGQLKGVADHELIIEHFRHSDRIQEAHMCAIHIIIEMIELQLFPDAADVDEQQEALSLACP